jgi:hypothetical protein
MIADNGKWEVGNATNKRKENTKVETEMGIYYLLFHVYSEGLALGTVL